MASIDTHVIVRAPAVCCLPEMTRPKTSCEPVNWTLIFRPSFLAQLLAKLWRRVCVDLTGVFQHEK
jgi:hypothetical protein